MSGTVLLNWIIFLPLVGAVLIGVLPRKDVLTRWLGLGFTLAVFFLSVPLWFLFDTSTHELQFMTRVAWIPAFNIEYAVGIDGISILLLLLTTLFTPICVICSWRPITYRVKEFMILILAMETAMLGVFSAQDLVLFYFFWEAMLIPMFLIIGLWGGPNRVYATIKFFLYTLLGSLPFLVAILALYFLGGGTFFIPDLAAQQYSATAQLWIFWALFLAFAVKIPMFPFHTWLPDAHVEAPTAGSVILASILLKMGGYGFVRFSLSLVPDASITFAPIMIGLSLVAIIWGSYMALSQTDLKKLVAYSSVAHMGFVTIGIFVFNTPGVEGAILQMINHGITTGALFLCVGVMYDRVHSRLIADCGGLRAMMPLYITMLAIFSFSSFGLPGTNTFIGELLVLVGAFMHTFWIGVVAIAGVILTAAYMLWMLYRMVWAEHTRGAGSVLPDLDVRELATLVPLVVFVFWIGLNPGPFLDRIRVSVEHLVSGVAAAQGLAFM